MATANSGNLRDRWSRRAPAGTHRSPRLLAVLAMGLVVLPAAAQADAYATQAPEPVQAAARTRIAQAHALARQRHLEATNNAEAAWQLARACYDGADLAPDNAQRARFAQEGIAAAQRALAIKPTLAAAYYYLGLNQGQLARTRKLSALGLLDDIEASWLKAIELDAAYDYAGPHRSIGILYRDAPGWPLSLGNRTKARRHLEKAVQLAPGYPDNQLSLLESYWAWGNQQAVRTNVSGLRKTLEAAKGKLTGDAWQLSWHDWEQRCQALLTQAGVPVEKDASPGE